MCPAVSNVVLRLALLFGMQLALSLVINLLIVKQGYIYAASGALAILGVIMFTILVVWALRGNRVIKDFKFLGERSQEEEFALRTLVVSDKELLAFAMLRNMRRP